MNARMRRAQRAIRCAGAVLAAATLSACGVSRVDGVAVKWPPFKEGTLVTLPADAAQCPDLAGTYRAQGERRSGEAGSASLADLRDFLAYPLDLPGLRETPTPWRASPRATVSFSRTAAGWDVLALDGQGAQAVGRLPLRQAGPIPPASADEAGLASRDTVQRVAGCTQGRLWVSVRQDWRQHESIVVRRHVAILRKEAGGLLVTVQRESDTLGMLLPWYTNDSDLFQYWFAPAADPA